MLIKNAQGHVIGTVIGTVGANGSTGDEDEAICMAGVAAARLVSA